MMSRKIIAYLLLSLQVLALTHQGIAVAAIMLEDPEEISAPLAPSSDTFSNIQKQWIRLNTNAPGPKVQKFDLSAEALEKIAKKKKSKKHNAQLLNSILDFFIATSPKQKSAVKFLKPRDWEDLQLFNTKNNLVSAISRTASKSGEAYLAGLVTQRAPIKEIVLRRDFIGALLERKDVAEKLHPLTDQFAKHELNLYSDTMQPENEVIKKLLESLAPGFLISKIPGAARNPAFLRFHALLTQKLAPWFYDPLTSQLALGFSVLAFMPNGIFWNIFKDFVGYLIKDANSRNITLESTGELATEKVRGYFESIKANGFASLTDGTIVPSYVRNQLCPKGHRLRFLKCLLNDLFLWQTNELRVALYKNRNAGTSIDQPEFLTSGPHCSLWGNAQYRRNVVLDPLVRYTKDWYQNGYGEPHKNNPKVTSPLCIITTMDDDVASALHGETSEERAKGILSSFAKVLKKVLNTAGTKAEEELRAQQPADDASWLKRRAHRLASWTAQKAAGTPEPTTQQPGTPAVAPRAANQDFLDRFDQEIKELERELEEPAKGKAKKLKTSASCAKKYTERKIFSYPATKKPIANILSFLENWKDSATHIKKTSLHLPIVKFVLWIFITYIFQLWQSNYGETQKNIKMLDGIMFETAKPGMLLISAASSACSLLREEQSSLSIPTSLKRKINAFEALAKKTCKEVVSLSKSATFLKETGHRILDHTGEVRRGYTLIQQPETKRLMVMAIHIMAEIDCYLGLTELIKEYATGENQFCPIEFIASETPFINAKNTWFPLLGTKAIGSDFLMGDKHAPNILLTGMNGGGKSICLKTIVFLIAMAHSFGWGAAQQCSMTPFSELNLHLNSLDNAADGKSRWVAEAEAIVSMINTVEAVHSPHYFVYLSGDELGDGTAADASIKVMGNLLSAITKQKRALSFIASHLQKLTELEGQMPRIFNYRINPDRKLGPGVNQTNIAMAIFEKFSNTKQKDHGLAAALANHASHSDVQMVG